MQQDIHVHRLLILDFGSQYTQLIARCVREQGVYSEVHSWDISDEDIAAFKPSGIILSGGPESVHFKDGPRVSLSVFDSKVPVLGICYGMQTMAAELGGKVETSAHREFGYAEITPKESSLLANLSDDDNESILKVWMSHGDRVVEVPPGFKVTASSSNSPLAVMENSKRNFYGLQFHPEVTHTPQGKEILRRFVRDICKCPGNWTADNIVSNAKNEVRKKVGNDKVLLGLSGGVDSTVVAALLHEAIGNQLVCVFVDHGLMRHNEGDQIMETFSKHMNLNVIRVNAADRFFNALKGISDPEQKRKIIGTQFIEVFDEEASKLNDIKWLAQGTIYPDVIESARSKTGKAHVIKSHHNVGGLPDYMRMSLVEPLRELFKDEVREIGIELGLPEKMVYRHPFPGPGLGVRILGEVKKEFATLLQLADNIFIEELHMHNLYKKTSQAFAVFLPIKSVGVMGDGRKYDYVIALRAVETIDFMTARWARLPHDFLEHVSLRIINEIEGISRVTYDISGKPPATIEWE
ncbi:MAG: glutamine-hydrolyzing GMP synthase [Gammaproteobacteria bacterium]|nr:glutamine-hydrolyzing GMP synthase [Gammaproteobacteria bacterium]